MGNSGCLPQGKPAETESRYQLTVHAGCFSVPKNHRTLTWTMGSLTCAQMYRMRFHTGVYGHRKRVCIESGLGEKIPCRTGESNLRRQRAGSMLYQLSYIPTPVLKAPTAIYTTLHLRLHPTLTMFHQRNYNSLFGFSARTLFLFHFRFSQRFLCHPAALREPRTLSSLLWLLFFSVTLCEQKQLRVTTISVINGSCTTCLWHFWTRRRRKQMSLKRQTLTVCLFV